MADNEEQVDWEDGDEGQDFWRGPEPSGVSAVTQVQPVAADDDEDDVISLLGDTVAATPATAESATPAPAPAPVPEQSAAPSSPLPEGWTSHMSKTHGRKYYIHTATAQRRWDRPPVDSIAAAPLTPPLSPALPSSAPTAASTKSSSIPTAPSGPRGTSATAAPSSAEQAAASAYASRHSKALPAVSSPVPPSGPRSQRGSKRRESGPRFDSAQADAGYANREAKRPKMQTEQGSSSSTSQATHTTNSKPLSPRPSRPLPSGPSNSSRDQRDRAFNAPRDDRRTMNQPRSSPSVVRPPPAVSGVNTAPVVNSRWGSKTASTPAGPSQDLPAARPTRTPPPTQARETSQAPARATSATTDAERQAEIDRAIAEGIRLGREQERKRIADEEAAQTAKRRADEQATERRKAMEQRGIEEKRQREAGPPANRWGTRGVQAPDTDRGFPSRPADGSSRPAVTGNGFRGAPGPESSLRRSPERRERSPVRNGRSPLDRPGPVSRPSSTYDSYQPGDRGRERSPPPAPKRWGRPPARSPSPIKDSRFTRRSPPPPRGLDRYTAADGPPRPSRSLQDRMQPRVVVAEPMSRRSPPPPRGFPASRPTAFTEPPLASRMAVDDRPPIGLDRRGGSRGGRR